MYLMSRGCCRFAFFLLLTVWALFIASVTTAQAAESQTLRIQRYEHHPSQLLIKFRANAPARNAEAAVRTLGAEQVVKFKRPNKLAKASIDNWRVLRFRSGTNIEAMRTQLLKNRHVERVEYNYKVRVVLAPNDPMYPQLWGLNNTGQTGGLPDKDIDAPEAWDMQTGNPSTVVAVIDTGVDYTHPDLATNVWTNPSEIPGNGIDDDGNGYVDDVHGYDFVNNDGDPMDDHGHGTHCAGTIAAEGNNGIGVAGVSWRGKIMALKFLSADGWGYTDAAVQAVLYAANMNAKVLSNSWGGAGFSDALNAAIVTADQAGALFVAAAGNGGSDNDFFPHYPSNYDVPNVLAVTSTEHNDAKAWFANWGAKTVDLGAPGVDILSTVPTVGNPCCSNPSGYALLSGTSMATPHVAGAAALLIAQFPGITHAQVKARLMTLSDPIPALQGITVTGGRLNVASAMETDTTPPSAVTNLATLSTKAFSATMSWTATGDDGTNGTASSYELRYSTAPIDETNFGSATLAANVPASGPSGTTENYTITGLEPSASYYIALKVRDNVGNLSPVSNVTSAKTQAVQVLFQDNFESNLSKWSIAGSDGIGGPALWHISPHRFSSPSNALYYGIESTLNFDTGAQNFGTITSGPISLRGSDAVLKFSYFLQAENSGFYDVARVQVSNNGGSSWTDVAILAPNTAEMTKQVISLAAYERQTIQIRFSFDTIDSIANYFEGWVIDDVAVVTSNLEQDKTPPAAVGNLQAQSPTTNSVTLTWTAPGDDGNAGTATSYDMRYSTMPLNEANFATATPVPNLPAPGPAGTAQLVKVSGLIPGTIYYFALKSADNMNNLSAISNVATVSTVPELIVFSDNFESGISKWTLTGSDGVGGAALWHISKHRVASPSNAVYYGKESTLSYETGGSNYGAISSGDISLKNIQQARLTFNHFLATENLAPYDTARIQVSTNSGTSWTDLYVTALGTGGVMEAQSLSLSAYDGQTIRLRFYFDTVDPGFNNYEGWVIDDVAVKGVKKGKPK